MAAIRPGIWVDYRGAYFEVLHIGQDAQSPLDVVIYRALGESAVMVMPRFEFAGIVEAFGERYWRFTALTEPNLFFDGERRAA